eukprot:CAMPEP_0168510718 /NCGR_PEP_ID=MMETSP0405-20121227/1640_1 /TAXON_ID=498012 /ORGANISM="Trichosphaerium sp, Strain Am-I-7 wt" /LENGTH=164 /DNA_ID=CAMNT_0008528625 /DNA_START=171 /DNA_END=662 /DNA_ORIENTATION=-
MYNPTIEEEHFTKLKPSIPGRNKVFTLRVIDVSGEETYLPMQQKYVQEADGFLICYSSTSSQSFEYAPYNMRLIENYQAYWKKPQVVVVGTKADIKNRREVSTDIGERFAKQCKARFVETSAKTGDNIKLAFELLLLQIIAMEQRHKSELRASKEIGDMIPPNW